MRNNRELFKCNEWETQNDNIGAHDLTKMTWPTMTYIDYMKHKLNACNEIFLLFEID
jgi:hypothetical protein